MTGFAGSHLIPRLLASNIPFGLVRTGSAARPAWGAQLILGDTPDATFSHQIRPGELARRLDPYFERQGITPIRLLC